MYHCHVRIYCVDVPHPYLEVLRHIPPLEHFSHTFTAGTAGESPRPAGALAGADVILARIPTRELPALLQAMKPDARLILLADAEQAAGLEGEQPRIDDIWPFPLTDWQLRFYFRRWQRQEKEAKDFWQTSHFLDAAINGLPGLVWYKTKDGIHEKVNDTFCKIVGKPRERVEGQTHASIWDVERDDPACVKSEQEVMEYRKTCVSEEVVQTGGGRMHLTTYKSPLYDLDGSVMGTVGIALDVTRERTYEEEILKKTQTLEKLFSTMDCGVIYHSLDGKHIIRINRAALQLLGYSSLQEMLDNGFALVAQSVLDEDKPKLRACIRSLVKPGDSVSTEYRVHHKDGQMLHILGSIKLVEESGELFYQRFLLDITDRKQKETEKWEQKNQELAYQEQMFEVFSTLLADKLDDVYIMMDSTGTKIEFITPNVERVLGVSAEAVLSDPASLGHAEYISGQEIGAETLAALQPGMSLMPMETGRIHRKTGERRYFQESVYCISLQGMKKVVAFISDRTAERKTRDTLTEALNMAQVANQAKSTFLSSVSHDIRTPMNAIMGLAALLQDEAGNPQRVQEYARKMSAAGQHLLGLVNDVLDLNKIESGSAVLNISEMTLAEVVDELNTIIRPQTRARHQTFEIYAPSLINERLLGDKLRINQIMINILSNAVKYTQTGGRIVMRVDELPQVDKKYSRIRFSISDDGQGMSKEYQQVIFDPFTREQEIVWNQVQGTGLGMAITKRLVDLMGGTIRVESEIGKGSTFTVELELRIQEEENDAEFWPRHHIARMLVVDDEEDVCRSVMRKMESTGVTTGYATDGTRAVEMVRAAREQGKPYDLVLLDWKMPGLDGSETARLIRENDPKRPMILLFTAYDWAGVEQEALTADIKYYLPKPFFMSSFKDAIVRMTQEQGKKEEPDSGREAIAGKNILIVDDIEVNRMILVKILSSMGAHCKEAVDGQDAVDQFTASQPGDFDIILMDIQMPHINGYDATKAIRASGHPSAQSVAIIAMSANAFIDDIRTSLESGMDAHIPKPVVVGQMKQTIQEVLEKKAAMAG